MKIFTVDFIPPIMGIDASFNTIRPGGKWAKKLSIGEVVALTDSKEKAIIGWAKVTALHTGKLKELCDQYGHQNHTQIGLDRTGAGDRLYQIVLKIYGPHMVNETRLSSVIELERLHVEKKLHQVARKSA